MNTNFSKIIYLLEVMILIFVLSSCYRSDFDMCEDSHCFEDVNKDTTTIIDCVEYIDEIQTKVDEKDFGTKNSFDDYNNTYQIELHIEKIDEVNYGIGYEGEHNLENGLTFLFAVLEEDEILWIKSWNNIHISEADYYSGVELVDDTIIMAVNGTLYSIHIVNGEINWEVDNIGFPSTPPIVEDGYIYIVSEKKPYLSIINENGIVEAQLNSDKLYGIEDIYFVNGKLNVVIYTDEIKKIIIDNINDFKE